MFIVQELFSNHGWIRWKEFQSKLEKVPALTCMKCSPFWEKIRDMHGQLLKAQSNSYEKAADVGVYTGHGFSSRADGSASISMNTAENRASFHSDTSQSTVTHTQDVFALSIADVIQLSYSSNLRNFPPEVSSGLLCYFLHNMTPSGAILFLSFHPNCQAVLTPVRFFSQLSTSHHGCLGRNMIGNFHIIHQCVNYDNSPVYNSPVCLLQWPTSVPIELCTTTHNTSSLSFKKIFLIWGTVQFFLFIKEIKS